MTSSSYLSEDELYIRREYEQLKREYKTDLAPNYDDASKYLLQAVEDVLEETNSSMLGVRVKYVKAALQVKPITIHKWYTICDDLVLDVIRMTKEHHGESVYTHAKAFHILLSETIPKSHSKYYVLGDVVMDPAELACELGLLKLVVPDLYESCQCARNYFLSIVDRLKKERDTKAVGLGHPNLNMIQQAINILEEIAVKLDHNGTSLPADEINNMLSGKLLAPPDMRELEHSLIIYHNLWTLDEHPEWIDWSHWAYSGLGGHQHRARLLVQGSAKNNKIYYSETLHKQLILPHLSGEYFEGNIEAFQRKEEILPGGATVERFFALSLVSIPKIDTKVTEQMSIKLEEYITRMSMLMDELNKGPMKKYIEYGQDTVMTNLTLKMFSIMNKMYAKETKITLLHIDNRNYAKTVKLSREDTPETLLQRIYHDWVAHVSITGKAKVDLAKSKKLFLQDEETKKQLLTTIRMVLGDYPLLNLYTQAFQAIAMNVSGEWVMDFKSIFVDVFVQVSATDETVWPRALENLLFERVFYPYSIRRGLAFPTHLFMEVAKITYDREFLFGTHEALTAEELDLGIDVAQIEQSLHSLQEFLREEIRQLSVASQNNTYYAPDSALLCRINEVMNSDNYTAAKQPYYKLQQAYTSYLRLLDTYILQKSTIPCQNVVENILDPAKDPAHVQETLTNSLTENLLAFRILTNKDRIPMLFLTKKNEMENMIIKSIVDIKKYGRIAEISAKSAPRSYSVLLLLYMIRKYEFLYPHEATADNLLMLRKRYETLLRALTEASDVQQEFERTLTESQRVWWNGIRDSFFNPKETLKGDWACTPLISGFLNDENNGRDIAYLLALRSNYDAVREAIPEWFFMWLGQYIQSGETKAQKMEVITKVFRSDTKDEMMYKELNRVVDILKPLLLQIRIVLKNIRDEIEPPYDSTDSQQKGIYVYIKDIAQEDSNDKKAVLMKVLEWMPRKDKTYHREEFKIAKKLLGKKNLEMLNRIIDNKLWVAWQSNTILK